jgi:hypothetical protein
VDLRYSWIDEVESSLLTLGFSTLNYAHSSHDILVIERSSLIINLLSIDNNTTSEQVIALQEDFHKQGKTMINLWEDRWICNRDQVMFRLKSLLGLNYRIHGRKTILRRVSRTESDTFFNLNHLQGTAKARHLYGLFYNDEIVAVAGFSGTRLMPREGENYRSAELVRFACKGGVTVIGGLTKLIKHFMNELKPDDLMSYADRDWSVGKGYDASGFVLNQTTDPMVIWLCKANLKRYFIQRLPLNILRDLEDLTIDDKTRYLLAHNFIKLFNTGNLKYKLYK